jgi:hypothetical protein
MSNYQDLPMLYKTTYREIMRGYQADRDAAYRGIEAMGPGGLGILTIAECLERQEPITAKYEEIKDRILNELNEAIDREQESKGWQQ